MYVYRVVMLVCRILIGAAVGLTALTLQMRTTSRGKFVAFRRLPYPDDDESTEGHTFVNRFPTGWWFGLFFLVVGCVVLDHHATLSFATPLHPTSPGRRLLWTSAVVLVEVMLIFGCHEVFFNVAVRPIFNHGLTLKTH